jgi:nitrite reductase/ring-hydroxylating ferredoxin subunit/uncharacterized membrane protein
MNWLEKFEQILDRQAWLESTSQAASQAIQNIYSSAGPVGIKVRDALHGVWLGHPVHTVITDVAVGAVTTAVLLDILDTRTRPKRSRKVMKKVSRFLPGIGHEPADSLARAADASLALGVASGLASGLTGATDWQHTMDRPRRVGFVHALLNISSLIFYSFSLVQRRQGNRQAGKALALTGILFTTAAGYLGGHMSFGFKVGVNRAPVQGLPEEFSPVMDEASLPEGKPVRAHYNDIPLVLVRRGSKIYALAETCAHMGGPLAEGELKEAGSSGAEPGAPVIVCPWHGSQFAMDSGEIRQGPSVYPQPCFETRVSQGKVELRVRPNPDLEKFVPD